MGCGVIGLVMGEWGVCGGKNARGRGGEGDGREGGRRKMWCMIDESGE